MYVCTGGLSAWLPSRACACACHLTEHPFDPTPRTCTAGTCASNPRKLSGCPTIEELRVCDPNVQFRWSVERTLDVASLLRLHLPLQPPPSPSPPPMPSPSHSAFIHRVIFFASETLNVYMAVHALADRNCFLPHAHPCREGDKDVLSVHFARTHNTHTTSPSTWQQVRVDLLRGQCPQNLDE